MADSTMRIIITAVDKATGTFKSVGKEAQGMTSALKSGGLNIAAVAKGLAVVAAAGMAAKKAFDFGAEGAQINRLRVSTAQLAQSYGGNMGAIVTAVQKASLNTISRMDAIQSSGRAMMLGLGADTQQLANLMEIAAFRGRVMGVNTTNAFNDIVTGIGRKSRMILDNLGIIIDTDKAYQDYADSMGMSVDQMDAAAQTQAYLNAVLKEGNALMEQAGGLTFDMATAYERVGAKFKDFTDTIKENVGSSILQVIASPEEVKQVAGINEEMARLTGNYDDWLGALDSSTNWQPWQWDVVSEDWLQYSKRMERVWADIQRYQGYEKITLPTPAAAMPGVSATDLQVGLSSGVTDIMEKHADAVQKAGGGTVKLNQANENLADSITELTFELAALDDAMDTEATFEFAMHMGLIDQKSVALQRGLSKINQAFDKNGNGMIELAEQTDAYWAAIDQLVANRDLLMQDKNATWSITLLLNGVNLGSADAISIARGDGLSNAGLTGFTLTPRAVGGPVSGGQPYLVGERGPELFMPNSNGSIVPNNKLAGNSTFKFYGNPTFVLGNDGMSASDLMRQMGVAA